MHTQRFSDAQSALGFVTPAFYNIERTVYQRRYPSYDYASLIPVITEGSEWARGTLFRSSDVTGKAEFLSGKAQDLPYADVIGEQFLKSFELAGIGYEWTLEEVETAAMEGRNLSDEKAQAARKVAESFLWNIAMTGNTEKGWTGLINDPQVTSGTAIADGAGSSPAWANKDADKILRDVNNAIGGVSAATRDVELADTVLLPFDRWNRLATTRLAGEGSVSILKFLQENNAYTAETGVPLTVRALRALRADRDRLFRGAVLCAVGMGADDRNGSGGLADAGRAGDSVYAGAELLVRLDLGRPDEDEPAGAGKLEDGGEGRMSTVSGLTPAVIVSLIAVGFSVLVTWAGVIIWAMRQEGRINLANERIDHFNDKLASSVAALAKFDENTQSQVENYQQNTERKIDELGRNMSAKFEKVFDKLDQKVDKD
jgi:hypothetical protein